MNITNPLRAVDSQPQPNELCYILVHVMILCNIYITYWPLSLLIDPARFYFIDYLRTDTQEIDIFNQCRL